MPKYTRTESRHLSNDKLNFADFKRKLEISISNNYSYIVVQLIIIKKAKIVEKCFCKLYYEEIRENIN